MTTAILSAMTEENDLLLRDLTPSAVHVEGQREYHAGELFGEPVVVVFSRWGKVAAATTTTALLKQFEVDRVIFTGLAGALDPSLRIGDVVVADELMQHDLDASPIFPKFETPLLGVSRFATDAVLRERLLGAAESFVAGGLAEEVDVRDREGFGIDQPAVHSGLIVSGDQFISDGSEVARLRAAIPDALCVEMEGAAMAQVCFEYGVPFAVLRIISDTADGDAGVDFPRFLTTVAAKFSLGVVRAFLAG
jgi:adenosylhomocysteine nucleosidase